MYPTHVSREEFESFSVLLPEEDVLGGKRTSYWKLMPQNVSRAERSSREGRMIKSKHTQLGVDRVRARPTVFFFFFFFYILCLVLRVFFFLGGAGGGAAENPAGTGALDCTPPPPPPPFDLDVF